jgi:hypothetical protein
MQFNPSGYCARHRDRADVAVEGHFSMTLCAQLLGV